MLWDYAIFRFKLKMGNCLGQPNPGNELQKINPQIQHSPQGKQTNRIHILEKRQISIAEMRLSTAKPSKEKQLQQKENKPIKCNAIQANKAPHVFQQISNEDMKKLVAGLIRKSKKGLIVLRQSSSLQNSQDQPEKQEPISHLNTEISPHNQLSFGYQVKIS